MRQSPMSPAQAVEFLAFIKPFSDENRQKHADAIDILRVSVEQMEALREECADWERGADEELARAWMERALDRISCALPFMSPALADVAYLRRAHQGDYEPPEIDDWRPGDHRPKGTA